MTIRSAPTCAARSCAPIRNFAVGSLRTAVPALLAARGFKAEPGRYHLFVSYNCPWAHRTIIFRKLKKLENVISMSLADKPKTAGWAYAQPIDDFKPENDGVFRLHQVYQAADSNYTGKVTVPTLWDRERRTIVNNESSEIIRMLNAAFARPHRG